MANLREKKEELRKEWEDCFERGLDTLCNGEGLEHFYDDNTTLDEAEDMISFFAKVALAVDIADKICDGNVDVAGVIVVKKELVEDEPKSNIGEGKEDCKYAVLNRKTNQLYSERFNTEEGAQDYLKYICMNSEFKADDLEIVKEDKF